MQTQNSRILFWISIFIAISLIHIVIPPKYSFYGDSLIKLLMAKSLLLHEFQSIEYFYFFKDLDPNYTYFPIDYPLYHIQKNNLHFGPFGVVFSFFSALFLKVLPYSFLPLLSSLTLVLLVFHLRKVWEFSYFTLGFFVFCTSVLIYVTEFSENIFFIFLSWISFSFLFKDRWNYFLDVLLASFSLVLSISLRLESLLYFGFWFPIFAYYALKTPETQKKLVLFLAFMFVFMSMFFGINFFLYGHILGSKYLADKGNFYLLSIKFMNYLSLWIGLKEEMFFKPGFLGLTPLFIVVFYKGIQKFKSLSVHSKIFFSSASLYFLFAPIFAPHDGHWSWGARYLNVILLPLCVVLNETNLLVEVWSSSIWKKFVLSILLFSSFFQVILGIFIISISCKVMKQVQESTSQIYTDFRLYHSGILALHTGPQVLETPSLLVQTEKDLESLIFILKTKFFKKSISYIHSEKLEALLRKGDVQLKLNEKLVQEKLSLSFQVLEEKNFGDFLIIRKYLIQ